MNKYLNVKNKVLKNNAHYLTSDYKTRSSRKNHNGMDLIGKNYSADYIVAITYGRVKYTGYSDSMGYYVFIDHGQIISHYFHMKPNSITVKTGEAVKPGQVIGYMGTTGRSKGVHLHFGVQKSDYVDPYPYLMNKDAFKKEKRRELQATLNTMYNEHLVKDGIIGIKTKTVISKHLLKKGNRGNYVTFVQKELYLKGYDLIVDGVFGQKTYTIVKEYQKNNKLAVDGIIGFNTINKLLT